MRIHIFGASGCGVSTLGEGLAIALSLPWMDNDQIYWLPTDPPFVQSRPIAQRQQLLDAFFTAHPHWINTGSMDSWGLPFIDRFTAAIFLQAPPAVRVPRLKKREANLFGARILEGGDMAEEHRSFIEWAGGYDHGRPGGRSLPRHRAFCDRLSCPLLELDAAPSQEVILDQASRWIAQTHP